MAEVRPAAYRLIGSLEPLKQDDSFSDKKWPLHVAILPSFGVLPAQLDNVSDTIQSGVDDYHHLMLEIGETSVFGKSGGITGYRVESGGLKSLHYDLVSNFRDQGIIVWSTGKEFTPYISIEGHPDLAQTKASLLSTQLIAVNGLSRTRNRVANVYPFKRFR